AFEQRVVGQKLFQFLVQLEGGKLQKTDGLLQLRRQRQVLRKLELQSLFHRYRGLGTWEGRTAGLASPPVRAPSAKGGSVRPGRPDGHFHYKQSPPASRRPARHLR